MEDDDNVEEQLTELRTQNAEKKKRLLELLGDVEECKSKTGSWITKNPAKIPVDS